MGTQNPGNFPEPGSEVAERQKIAKQRAAQRVCSWTMQNELRGRGMGSASAARRIFDSANPRKIGA